MHSVRDCLEQLRIPRDGVLFVHSAFRGVAREGLAPEEVCRALCDYMTGGTVAVPTMSWRYVKPGVPHFDELQTPCNVGALAECFRTHWATRRSLHPTHSAAARGRLADELLGEHHLDETPCSARSPFGKLVTHDAWILMIGITMDCCTLIHHGEELVAPDLYLKPPRDIEAYECTDRAGRTVKVRLRRHLLLHRDYFQFHDILARDGLLLLGRIGNVVCRAFRARDLHDRVVAALRVRPDAIIARGVQRYRRM